MRRRLYRLLVLLLLFDEVEALVGKKGDMALEKMGLSLHTGRFVPGIAPAAASLRSGLEMQLSRGSSVVSFLPLVRLGWSI